MRIADEKQLYSPGDKVVTPTGVAGVVRSVSTHSVYYEARPIASYLRYTYVVECSGSKVWLTADELTLLR